MSKINMTFSEKVELLSCELVYKVKGRLRLQQKNSDKYALRNVMDAQSGAKLLIDGLNSDKPFLVGRFGMNECTAATKYLHKVAIGGTYGAALKLMCTNAGFFPEKEEYLDCYSEMVLPLYNQLDMLCIMRALGEEFIIKHYCPDATLTTLRAIEPAVTQWTSVLKDKKVLVIHPFEESIRNQYYNNREKIYPGTDILPEFDLQTVKAVQTAADNPDERFASWFDALDYMTEEALKKDFDIALIGCGAYGLPLGARMKQAGKKAVHMGGCLQLLFGIRGARWDTRDYMKPFINEFWTRPADSEIPEKAKKVENACYW